ncbi:TonB-dependent receptor [Pelagicoccus albus]|uniref:TonB-dependent receptor n=1 Tax=Pelagicoccus albus TaxID=415222 RepID=A0A7X1B5W8_9BACT|nr:TonB-dependent receptor [Pelagicoccus albus]MBC2606122.1 TonB-dependent receptor [Pelagicoccus albus]
MKIPSFLRLGSCSLGVGLALTLYADSTIYLPAFQVVGQETSLHGEAVSASQGYVGSDDLALLMAEGAGGLLESVPGMIATQHSGTGKANQYFLRGFNLDHGTDFLVTVDGMPINMASHGHGQGYADMNFLIPEMVSMVSYLKGPYYAMVGDFSSAGSASMSLRNVFAQDFAELALDEYGQQRFVAGVSRELEAGNTLFAMELEDNDGPWDLDENLQKRNGVFRFSKEGAGQRFSLTAMAYDASWDATDQIPDRLVESGEISEFGYIDPTVGGRSTRYSLSANWRLDDKDQRTFASVYAIHYDMNLWSNFTYFLEDQENGDQFEQADRRQLYGFNFGKSYYHVELLGKQTTHTLSVSGRWDDIDRLGLYATRERERLSTVREDEVDVKMVSGAYEMRVNWTPRLRSQVGIRFDNTDISVLGDQVENSGDAGDSIASPKANLVYTMNDNMEWYLSAGESFHSNDARGAVVGVDPLVASRGHEFGFRYQLAGKFNSSVAFWSMNLDSELLYVGDAGGTEASLSSERSGVDWTTFFAISERLNADLDFAWSDGSFAEGPADQRFIPGVVKKKWGGGLSYRLSDAMSLGLRYRFFGERPLIEDGSVMSEASESVSLRISGKHGDWEWMAQVSNLFDSRDPDISYYYESRLLGELAEGVADIHSHVMKPRRLQVSLKRLF